PRANTSAFLLPTLILLSIPISVLISVLIWRLYSGTYSRARPLAAWRACRGLPAGCSGGRPLLAFRSQAAEASASTARRCDRHLVTVIVTLELLFAGFGSDWLP